MHVGRQYTLREFVVWSRFDSYRLLAVVAVPTLAYVFLGFTWLALPWVPIALIGTAAAFIAGFRNNATYARAWESRQIYGAIVNASRTWGLQVMDFVRAGGSLSEAEAAATRTQLIHRHVAWLTVLRFQLRQPRPWESMQFTSNAEYQARNFTIPERTEDLGDVLRPLLSEDDRTHVLSGSNRATRAISLQGRQLAALHAAGVIDAYHHVAMERQLAELLDQQGRAERIKNYPYPRQYVSISKFFVHLFIGLTPLGLLNEFSKTSDWRIWLTIPTGFLIGWVFNAMERVGQATENPFEGNANDTPITTLSRTIEIDLREMLGEEDIPAPIAAQHNIQI
ncbi:MAG: multidrug transporter [Gemmatimonadaceae bacterium]|nr:multidrug transporter [Gemmatimonadaceae bacterium]